ncbi:MAG: CocE/NonD family hydrolase [Proteobacteria bacterium]|nr:CocE/NonD family hydrolase [Pseudomonadota bacterium]
MSGLAARAARFLLGLGEKRCESWSEPLWLPMEDGTRLATLHVWPIGAVGPSGTVAPTLLVRTTSSVKPGRRGAALLGQLIAEHGYHVILQQVRGRGDSEGRFAPFENEARDGRTALEWTAEQRWCDGRIGLAGLGYGGYAAWAACAEAPERVAALAVGMACRDLHRVLYPGGSFSLWNALALGVGPLGEDETSIEALDLERAVRHRPVREADRVALCTSDAYRSWIDHPRRDAFWDTLCPPLAAAPPPTLLLAGWFDATLEAQLEDGRALDRAGAETRIVIGPWSNGNDARRRPLRHRSRRWSREESWTAATLRELVAFLDRHLRGAGSDRAGGARFWVAGAQRWREASSWPPEQAGEHRLYLRGGGAANTARGDGRLESEPPPADETPDRFHFDPERPVPSVGGPLLGAAGGPRDQREVETRADVLCYSSAPFDREQTLAGPVRLELHAASSAVDSDFTAKLVDVAPDGTALLLCEGVVRARWRGLAPEEKEPVWLEPGTPERFAIELGSTACLLPAGHRLRLEVSSSSFPRFDRSSNTRDDPEVAEAEAAVSAEQTVHHDAAHPSAVVLPVLD